MDLSERDYCCFESLNSPSPMPIFRYMEIRRDKKQIDRVQTKPRSQIANPPLNRRLITVMGSSAADPPTTQGCCATTASQRT
jgi:hypothetical protein